MSENALKQSFFGSRNIMRNDNDGEIMDTDCLQDDFQLRKSSCPLRIEIRKATEQQMSVAIAIAARGSIRANRRAGSARCS